MSRLTHPKWSFYGHTEYISYGYQGTFPDLESSAERIAEFRGFLSRFLSDMGIEEPQFHQRMYNTGGHSDIQYYALISVDDEGGCECVFYSVDWGGEYESLVPWVTLYGAWTLWNVALERALRQRYGGGRRRS